MPQPVAVAADARALLPQRRAVIRQLLVAQVRLRPLGLARQVHRLQAEAADAVAPPPIRHCARPKPRHS